jgi:hypothetical protein
VGRAKWWPTGWVTKTRLTYNFIFLKKRVITFSPHELPACVILPPRTTTSTKREHQTTIFTHFAPFCQSNSCKDLNALTQFQKWPKYPHLKKKKTKIRRKRGGCRHPWGGRVACEPPPEVACEPPPEVAPVTPGVARGPPRPKGWPYGHPRSFLGWPRGHPLGRGGPRATSGGGSQATRPPQGWRQPPLFLQVFGFFFFFF